MAKPTYHHGDLRRALLAAAADAITEHGVAALSMRDLARRAGVSHAAPTHHFGDKAGLLTALATEGFELLARALATSRLASNSFLEMGVSYVRFAMTRRAHFEVMFRPDLYHADDPDLLAARAKSGDALYAAVTNFPDGILATPPEAAPPAMPQATTTAPSAGPPAPTSPSAGPPAPTSPSAEPPVTGAPNSPSAEQPVTATPASPSAGPTAFPPVMPVPTPPPAGPTAFPPVMPVPTPPPAGPTAPPPAAAMATASPGTAAPTAASAATAAPAEPSLADVRAAGLAAWSMAHGFATLWLTGAFPDRTADPTEMARTLFSQLNRGAAPRP